LVKVVKQVRNDRLRPWHFKHPRRSSNKKINYQACQIIHTSACTKRGSTILSEIVCQRNLVRIDLGQNQPHKTSLKGKICTTLIYYEIVLSLVDVRLPTFSYSDLYQCPIQYLKSLWFCQEITI